MKKPPFVNEEIYHIYNRGVEKRSIFGNNSDRSRFIHDLFEFNDESSAPRREETELKNKRKVIVEILTFCLMPNHFHLLLRQKQNRGVINFMKKMGTGYTMYFNKKYERVGPLFQGRFKAVHVNSDEYFRYLCHYIHLNPLDTVMPEWRDGKVKSFSSAMKYLKEYRWSSLQDYFGIKNFPSVISKNLLSEVFEDGYKDDIEKWIINLDLNPISDLLLE